MKNAKRKVGRPRVARNSSAKTRFTTKSEAARILGIGRTVVENLCRTGELKLVRIGKGAAPRVLRTSVDAIAERLAKEAE